MWSIEGPIGVVCRLVLMIVHEPGLQYKYNVEACRLGITVFW